MENGPFEDVSTNKNEKADSFLKEHGHFWGVYVKSLGSI